MFKFFKILLFVLLFMSPSFSLTHAYTLQEPETQVFSDSQVWLPMGQGSDVLATGVCYGSLFEIQNSNGTPLGSLLSPCLYDVFDAVNSEASDSSDFGMGVRAISLLGIEASLVQVPNTGDWKFGVGVSVTEIYRKINGTEDLQKSSAPSVPFELSWRQLSPHEVSSLVPHLPDSYINFTQ